jgi:hypothetical protein
MDSPIYPSCEEKASSKKGGAGTPAGIRLLHGFSRPNPLSTQEMHP